MKKYLRIISLTLITSLLITLNGGLDLSAQTAQAAGDLTVNWGPGLSEGDPIFVVSNMSPGQMETRSVGVTNSAPSSRSVGVRGIPTDDSDSLSSQLNILITEGAVTRYGPQTLAQFFTASGGPDGIFLSNLNSGNSTTYDFQVTFKETSGNSWQNKSVVFDLKIGVAIDLPSECDNLNLSSTPIIGSSKAETLTGTPGNDLIMGLEGADKINGNGGDDCILGGSGADSINGNSDNDVIFGEDGADTINGNNGDDIIVGGVGADSLKGENGQDHLRGGLNADTLDGGNNDDILEGNEHADTLKGGNGSDNLDGGSGVDTANGNNGIDTCVAETRNNCELP